MRSPFWKNSGGRKPLFTTDRLEFPRKAASFTGTPAAGMARDRNQGAASRNGGSFPNGIFAEMNRSDGKKQRNGVTDSELTFFRSLVFFIVILILD